VALTAGRLDAAEALEVTCESELLVGFADGVESDHLSLRWGQRVSLTVAEQHLTLVVPD
jgi:hypothetical protein